MKWCWNLELGSSYLIHTNKMIVFRFVTPNLLEHMGRSDRIYQPWKGQGETLPTRGTTTENNTTGVPVNPSKGYPRRLWHCNNGYFWYHFICTSSCDIPIWMIFELCDTSYIKLTLSAFCCSRCAAAKVTASPKTLVTGGKKAPKTSLIIFIFAGLWKVLKSSTGHGLWLWSFEPWLCSLHVDRKKER